MKKRLWFLSVLCGLILTMTAQAATDPLQNPAQQRIKGTIDKITGDVISVKTDQGQTRDFTIAPVNQKEITVKGLKPGDRILLSFNQENQVTEIKLDEGAGAMENEPAPLNPNQAH
jgi:hypothetical protein